MTTRAEEHALCLVADDWDIHGTNAFAPRLEQPEALLHEVCHGLVFRMRLNYRLPLRVTDRFERVNDSPILGLTYEAKTFAVEAHALRVLGWTKRVRLRAIMVDVWKFGYSGPCLPKKMFLSLVRRFQREQDTIELGVKAAAMMLKLARRKIKDERSRSVHKKASR